MNTKRMFTSMLVLTLFLLVPPVFAEGESCGCNSGHRCVCGESCECAGCHCDGDCKCEAKCDCKKSDEESCHCSEKGDDCGCASNSCDCGSHE